MGLGLLGFAISFLFLSIMLFFDGGLMALGNIFLIAGLILSVGLRKSLGFFFDKKRITATLCLALGICIVLLGWPAVGIILELYGLSIILRGIFPGFIATIKAFWNSIGIP